MTMPVKLGNNLPGTLESNRKVAQHLILISMGLALDGPNHFKIIAFENAAQSVMLAEKDVATVTNLKALGGIGDSTAEVIREFCKRGTSTRYEDLATRHPMDALTMTVVDGIGPKGAVKLYEQGIKNFDQLVTAAREGKLSNKMRDAVLFAVGKERVPHEEAKKIAGAVVALMKLLLDRDGERPVTQYEVCGSIRRKAADSKDIDIVGCVPDPSNRLRILDKFVKAGTMIKCGEDRAAIRFSYEGRTMQVDLWLVPPESWGSALNYATGSKNHNVHLRMLAGKAGMTVNEYGIFKLDGDKAGERLGGADERDLYRLLGIPYVEPHERG